MSDSPLSAYLQKSDPVNQWKPGEGGQLVDLDEFYAETEQDKADFMVQGSESFSLNHLDRKLASILGIESYTQMDSYASERNARLGAEGFFSVVYEGFQSFIENIIKYIRMAIDWVANTVKGIFGFRKSDRIEKAIDSKLDNLKTEFEETLNGLGFPGGNYKLERFIGTLPNGVDRVGQLTVMKTKFETDKEAIEGLNASIPLFQQTIAELTKNSNKAVKSFNDFKRMIQDEYQKTRVRKVKAEHVDFSQSPEVARILKGCAETTASVSNSTVVPLVAELLASLYKVTFSNDELTNGFADVRKRLDQMVQLESVKLSQGNVTQLMSSIQALNAHYANVADNSIDMSGVNLRQLGAAIDKSDADKVKAMGDYYNAPMLVAEYQAVAVAVRNYTQFCQLVTRQLSLVGRQIDNLVRWHTRGYLWFYHALLDDLQKLRELNLEAKQQGHSPMMGPDGTPTIKFEFIDDADAKTFMEKFGGTSQEIIDKDIGNLKTIYNNLVKETGMGRTI